MSDFEVIARRRAVAVDRVHADDGRRSSPSPAGSCSGSRHGRRSPSRWSTFCVGTAMAAVAPVFSVLLLARIIQASGTAVMMPLLMTTLMTVVPRVRPRPRDGQRHPGHLGGPGARPGRVRRDPADGSWRLDVRRSCCRSPLAVTLVGLRQLENVGEPSAGSHRLAQRRRSPPLGFGGLVYGLSEFATGRPAPARR